MRKEYFDGFKKGLPIGLGYFAVAFAFGITAVNEFGFAPLMATIYSAINLSSTGQLAGVEMVFHIASYVEIGFAMLLINLRYLLMSLSLTQKLDKNIKWYHKAIFGFGITDETFAIAVTEKKTLTTAYMYALPLLPFIGWVGGTALGSFCSELFPSNLVDAMGVALYAMFIAIIVPDAKKSLPITLVILLAIGLSCFFHYVPGVNQLGAGLKVIICATFAALFGSFVFPIKDKNADEKPVEEITNE